MEVLDSIPVELDKARVIQILRLGDKGEHIENMVQELTYVALNTARPKAIYTVSYVNNKNGDSTE